MKYHLDTIPVWDAYHENKECAMCVLMDKAEKSYVESFLGGSVMEPDTRIQVNDKGFCPEHNRMLYKAQNRLGLALMTHTHTLETIKKMSKHIKAVEDSSKDDNRPALFKSKKGSAYTDALKKLADWMTNHRNSCIICDRMEYTSQRYIYTILYLWENDSTFKDTFKNSKGFCFHHLPMIIDMALENLSQRNLEDFFAALLPIQMESMDRQEKELHWFTLKFDYRNQDKPWGNSKDALPRLLQRLTGKSVE